MPASSLSYNNINSDSRMIPDIMRVFAYARTRFPYGRNNRKKFVHQKRVLQAFTDKSLKIAVFPIILALVRHFMKFERDFFPAACT